MKFIVSTSQYLGTLSKPVWWICLLLLADFFLLNRFDVPYSIFIDGWRIDPISMATLVIFTGLWWFYREQSGRAWTRPEKVSLWALLAWFLIAFLTTLFHPKECSLNYGGLACLATIGMWMLPVFVIPGLQLSRQDVVAILCAYLGLACIGVLINVFVLLIPHLVSWFAGWEKPPAGGRAFLPLGVATVLGCVFSMGIPLVIGLYYGSNRSRQIRTASMATCLLLIIGVFTTGSRASVAVTVLALVVSFIVIGGGKISSNSMKAGFVVGLLAVVIGFLLLGERNRLVSFYDRSIQWRLRGVTSAIEMVEDRPLLGSGVERFFHRISTGNPSYLFGDHGMETIFYNNRLTAREPHNLYLLTATETGIAGFLCLLMYLGGNLWFILNTALLPTSTGESKLLKGLAISIVVVLLQSSTESMLLARPRFTILVGILWGSYRRYTGISKG